MLKKITLLSILLTTTLQVGVYAHESKDSTNYEKIKEKEFNWGKSPNHTERNWKVLESDHFLIHYYQGFEKLAQETAAIGEDAYFKVTEDLKAKPSSKVPIILTQDEFFNGFAEPIKNRIVLDPVLMRSSVIGARRFLTHEFTHIITFEALSTGFSISKLYGAQNLPTWFMEGLAQYEAEYWYPSYDRMLRAHTYERSLLTPSERDAFIILGGDEGAAGYNEGYSLVTYILDTYGRETLAKLFEEVKFNNIPFNSAIERITGKSFLVIEADWRQNLEEKYRKQIEDKDSSIKNDEVVIIKPENKSEANIKPKLSPDGKILTYMSSQERSGFINIRGKIIGLMPLRAKLVDFKDSKDDAIAGDKNKKSGILSEKDSKSTILTGGVLDYAWSSDNKTVAYTQVIGDDLGQPDIGLKFRTLKIKDKKILSEEKYNYDFKIYDEKDITFQKPLKLFASPSFSQHERKIVFSASCGEENNIYMVNLDDFALKEGKIKAKNLTKTKDFFYRDLAWSPNNNYLAFNVYKVGSGGNIAMIDFKKDRKQQVTKDSVIYANTSPAWSEDSNHLYFVSDNTNISNIYRYNFKINKIEQLSNSYRGLDFPFIKNDYLYYTSYYAKGTDIRRIKKSELKILDSDYNSYREFREKKDIGTKKTYKSNEYQAWLTPDILLPITGVDEKGDQIGLRTSLSDMLGKHSTNLSLAYGIKSNRFSYGLTYINRMFAPMLGVSFSEYPTIAATQDAKDYYFQRIRGLTFVVTRPFFNEIAGELNHLGSIQLNFSELSPIEDMLAKDMKKDNLRQGLNNTIALEWFSQTPSTGYNSDIHPTNGYSFDAKLEHANKLLFSKFEYTKALANYKKNFPLLFGHAFSIRTDLEYITGNATPLLLGGPPINLTLGIQDFIPLRGFSVANFSGDRLALVSSEYRFPILTNLNTFWGGIYFDSIYGALFNDIGDAWFASQKNPSFNMGIGGELRLRLGLGGKGIISTYFGVGKPIFEKNELVKDSASKNQFYFGFTDSF